MNPVFVCRARVRKQVMGEMSGPLVQAVRDAGLADNLQQYILSRDIKSVEVMASIASKIEEVDEVLADPLASAFRLPDGSEIKLSKLELPIVKAQLYDIIVLCTHTQCLGSQLSKHHSFHELLAHSALVIPENAGAARRRAAHAQQLWVHLTSPHTLTFTDTFWP